MSKEDHAGGGGKVRKFEHPGRGRERARPVPKGRQIDPRAQDEIQGLLGARPRNRDLLIEYLHLIQDEFGQISAAHLGALAAEMRLAFAEVFETATFYAHFDVVKEGERDIPALTVRVCDSLTCAMFGAEKLLADLRSALGDERATRPGSPRDARSIFSFHHILQRLARAAPAARMVRGEPSATLEWADASNLMAVAVTRPLPAQVPEQAKRHRPTHRRPCFPYNRPITPIASA